MHAGSVEGVNNEGVGGQDTNTLILLHIFAGGQKAVGFSIPRDDWVTYPQAYDGQSQGKIDQAYGCAYAQSLSTTVNSSMSTDQRYLQANQAGQAADDRHRRVGHRPEDRPLRRDEPGRVLHPGPGLRRHRGRASSRRTAARTCTDANSGFNAVLDGYNLIEGRGPVPAPGGSPGAGVRPGAGQPAQRRPGPHPPAAGGPRLRDLEAGARRRPVRPRPAHRPARRRQAVPHHRLNLEPARLRHPDARADRQEPQVLHGADRGIRDCSTGQDANQIDIPTIQAAIKAKFTAPAPAKKSTSSAQSGAKAAPIPAASTVTVDVYNGGTTAGLATGVSQALVAKGYKAGAVTDASAQSQPATGHPGVLRRRARPPTRPRSRTTSARPPRRSRRCPPDTSRCCSAPGPPWCRPAWPRASAATPSTPASTVGW